MLCSVEILKVVRSFYVISCVMSICEFKNVLSTDFFHMKEKFSCYSEVPIASSGTFVDLDECSAAKSIV